MSKTRSSNGGMKSAVRGLLLIAFAAMPAEAQQGAGPVTTSRLTCPAGHYLLGEVCISNETGDVVLATKK